MDDASFARVTEGRRRWNFGPAELCRRGEPRDRFWQDMLESRIPLLRSARKFSSIETLAYETSDFRHHSVLHRQCGLTIARQLVLQPLEKRPVESLFIEVVGLKNGLVFQTIFQERGQLIAVTDQ